MPYFLPSLVFFNNRDVVVELLLFLAHEEMLIGDLPHPLWDQWQLRESFPRFCFVFFFFVVMLSCVRLLATRWTITCQAPLSMEFFRQEYRSGLKFPPSWALPNPGVQPASPVSPVFCIAGSFFTHWAMENIYQCKGSSLTGHNCLPTCEAKWEYLFYIF